jgi:carboxyl-terminal processing protease
MKRSRVRRWFYPLLVAGILVALSPRTIMAADPEPTTTNADSDTGYSDIATFAKAVELIRQDYVDGSKISYHDLVYAAMKGMLSSLDPHSQFMDPADFKDMQDDTRSRFNGLGVEVAVRDGLLTVVTPMEDTPAAQAGIQSGDQILKINGVSTDKLGLQDAVNILRGEPGQKVTLTILRPSTKEIKDYPLERKEIKVQSVKGVRLLDPELTGPFKVGYVRIVQFNEPTAEEFGKALDSLEKAGNAGAGAGPAQQSGRPAQQCGRCAWSIPASEHKGGFHPRARFFAKARLLNTCRG